jgi:hypothetical protein
VQICKMGGFQLMGTVAGALLTEIAVTMAKRDDD